jgi:cytochrome c oxidase subunit 2
VLVALVFIVVRFRSESDELPEGRDRWPVAEGLSTLALLAIAGVLVFLTFSTMSQLEDSSAAGGGEPAVEIDVTASQWQWRFEYPEEGIVTTAAGEGPPTLVVPADTPVEFNLTSLDVIHSFFIPSVRFKRDAFPERETTFSLIFPEVGFEPSGGACAEYCGLRHGYMTFNVDVKEPADYEAWVSERRALEAASTGAP